MYLWICGWLPEGDLALENKRGGDGQFQELLIQDDGRPAHPHPVSPGYSVQTTHQEEGENPHFSAPLLSLLNSHSHSHSHSHFHTLPLVSFFSLPWCVPFKVRQKLGEQPSFSRG
uniref:Uncharacterized protein n=1 Tax=Coccidioides posadasii RMSCC 3488 TaxID=454284 RepID=A0A0J6F5I1_COCPO|nr:hypothetical protein CPAG_00556 [Coccidioides posadasii RMSCC 3488]